MSTKNDLDFSKDADSTLHTRALRLLVQVNKRHAEVGSARDQSHALWDAEALAESRYRACLAEIAKRRRVRWGAAA